VRGVKVTDTYCIYCQREFRYLMTHILKQHPNTYAQVAALQAQEEEAHRVRKAKQGTN
jgi:hypothetical protein